jgi:hypothetical protein
MPALQDPQLRAAAKLLQDALLAPTVDQEEALWYSALTRCVAAIVNAVHDPSCVPLQCPDEHVPAFASHAAHASSNKRSIGPLIRFAGGQRSRHLVTCHEQG